MTTEKNSANRNFANSNSLPGVDLFKYICAFFVAFLEKIILGYFGVF